MLTFTPVTQRDIARLRRYYKSCEYQLCEYSALVEAHVARATCTPRGRRARAA